METQSKDSWQFDVMAGKCPSRAVLEHVTSKWGALTLAALSVEPARFGEVRRRIDGISDKMLSQTLKSLESDGFVDRRVESTMPPHVEYALTSSGQEVAGAVGALITTLYRLMPDVIQVHENA